MIVYAARFEVTDQDPRSEVGNAIEQWLKTSKQIADPPSVLDTDGKLELGRNEYIEAATTDDSVVSGLGFRYSHPDRNVRGREWLTEIGVESNPNGAQCTVLLHTRETSTRVFSRTHTTRPLVVQKILAPLTLKSGTPGGVARPLTANDCEAFMWSVNDAGREHPIVQVSPTDNGGYLVDPNHLADLLTGIADLVVIPPGENTFAISDALGSRFSAYHGAVNILWPSVERDGQVFVPSTRLLADELEEIRANGGRSESELLSTVCSRTNDSIARRHVSVERIRALGLQARLEAARAAGEEDTELAQLAKEIDGEQKSQIDALDSENQAKDREIVAMKAERDELARDRDALKAQLQRASQAQVALAPALSASDLTILTRALTDSAVLEDCIKAVAVLYPHRLVVLESAVASARKSKQFTAPRKAFELLSKLGSEYYDALAAGRGDQEARQVFGKAYAPKESETVEKNKRACDLRTFEYNGKNIPMMSHLKIGVKDSKTETFRCHFTWDAESRRIVIGHCGKHLDFK